MQVEHCGRKTCAGAADDAERFFFYRERVTETSAGDSVTAGSPANFMMAVHEIARDYFDVESGDAKIAALKDLLRYLKGEKLPF
jgi:hypothetical protein